MKDRLMLLAAGLLCSCGAWVLWHWWSEYITLALLILVLVGQSLDNQRLRRQVRGLVAERDQRERRGERQRALQRLWRALRAVREQRGIADR
ncbi:hypothetical protein [Duganella callida]|uniref:Uncharacterized protein n=1 Tax=Duganella callida TaxID=2561932 RepID=A0A4Y9RX33_9BURK|nr:hypothetical protein [Duganella callida]TFW13837.1 hypothetical protein E4L98_28255 [Duganella callida]